MADSLRDLRATAYWTISPGHGALKEESLREPAPGEAVVRALHSGISRGTELLVHSGQVPAGVAQLMRAPFQDGDFPGAVKYGYLSVGVVETGPDDLIGRRVFCLYPHQDRYVVPTSALQLIPDDVPSRRAVLAGAVETAVNALWDAAPRIGDRVAVVGAGMVGCAVARLLRSFPLQRLELVDVDPRRAPTAEALGVTFREPGDARGDCDLVVHTSASAAGLAPRLDLLGDEGEVVELSWYGDVPVSVPLGSAFHPRRLAIRASQVGEVSAARRARRSRADRLALALDLLRDDAFDALITGSSPFADLPDTMRRLASGDLPAVCHVVDY
jgi:hypothetical protein